MRCQYKVGFFIVRECGREGNDFCSKCQTPICDAHRYMGAPSPIVCQRCAPTQEGDEVDDDHDMSNRREDSSWRNSAMSSRRRRSRYSESASDLGALPVSNKDLNTVTGGGQASSADSSLEGAGFTETDSDLFDKVSDFDEKESGRSSYDS